MGDILKVTKANIIPRVSVDGEPVVLACTCLAMEESRDELEQERDELKLRAEELEVFETQLKHQEDLRIEAENNKLIVGKMYSEAVAENKKLLTLIKKLEVEVASKNYKMAVFQLKKFGFMKEESR